MSFFGRKRTRVQQTTLLKPRRSRIFRRVVRDNSESTRRSVSWWTVGYAFLWMMFFGAALYTLLFSSLLRVKQKTFAPTETLSEREISSTIDEFLEGAWFGVIPKDTLPVAYLRRHTAEQLFLERFPILRSARVSFTFPETIALSFEERTKTLILCSAGPCFAVDERGFAFDQSPRPADTGSADDMLVIIDRSAKPVSFQDPNVSEEFLDTFPSLRADLLGERGIATLRVAETPSRLSDELWFRTSEGWELRMSAVVPRERAFLALRLLFEKTLAQEDRTRLEYVDLRTENRIFYLLKGGEEKEGEKMGDDGKKEEKKKKKD